jgi:glycosyltransferase involved in cell wall biosynthesis
MKENNVLGILNFWLGECALIGKYAAKKYHVKNFTWILGQDAKKQNRYFTLIKPKAENLIALSDFLSNEFYKNYKIKPVHTIPPGINIDITKSYKAERDIDILGAGSLIPLKQYDIFIQVVAEVNKSKPGIKAVICGKGPELKHLQKMIKQNDLSENIQLIGEVTHQQVLDLMQRTKVFLHPSSFEGFGLVISEALYAGAKVVSFCKPMRSAFKNQFVVTSQTEMIQMTNEILNETNCYYENIITCPIEETCRKILSLY